MIRYVFKRILWLIPIIIAVSFIVFALIELAPGTIVDQMIQGDMTPEDVAALRAKYDLDKPMLYRYGKYMLNLIQGDLGLSQASGLPVFDTYFERLPSTLLLSFTAAVIGVALAIPMGIRAARRAGTITDTATTTFALVGMSMPGFWLGLLLMLLLSMKLEWLPAGGNKDGIRSLIMPAICSAMILMATSARQTRSSMLEVLKADFLRTARAKGAPEKIVVRKHALGNALIPVITAIGSAICVQLAGSAVIEQVFAWPGVGRMLIEGVKARDVTVIIGCVIMTSILYVLIMLIVDLAYALVDPRIKAQYMRKKRKRKGTATVAAIQSSDARETGLETSATETVSAGSATHIEASRGSGDSIETPASSESRVWATDLGDPADTSYSGSLDFVTRQEENIAVSDKALDVAEIISKYKKRSQIGEIWHRLLHNKGSLAGIIILGSVFLIAIVSLFMSFDSVNAPSIPDRFSGPSWQYLFGTDSMGRNAFLRVIYGTRYSIIIGFGSVAISTIIGVMLGSAAAYYGGWTDNIIMRISDTLASIPGLLLGMVIMVVLGMKLENLLVAVGVGGVPTFIRIARASILTVKGNEFVEASRAIGFSNMRIILTQVLPNGLSPIIVQATASLGLAIIVASSLSFLGFGVPAPTPEWGALIAAGREHAHSAPWLMAFPGLFIMITVLGFNLIGDGLRDALDPKMKR